MKMKSIVAFVENKKGDFWQIALSKEQQACICDLILDMHGKSIKILRNKVSLYYPNKNDEHKDLK